MPATHRILYELPASTAPDRDRLRAVADLLASDERLAAVRAFFLGVVVALAAPMFVVAAWPRLLPEGWRAFVLLCDAGSLVALGLAVVAARRVAARLKDRCTSRSP